MYQLGIPSIRVPLILLCGRTSCVWGLKLEHPDCSAEEHVQTIVDEGAVDALVPHLHAPVVEEGEGPIACEHEVEKDAAFALGLLAVKVSNVFHRIWPGSSRELSFINDFLE